MVLVLVGVSRLPAEIIDIPGNAAAEALSEGQYVNEAGVELVLETRLDSLVRYPNARRWFAVGRAYLVAGDPAAAADAFRKGLKLAPANGIVWAEYARALSKSGRKERASEAFGYSIERAPHDPRAIRIRRK